MWFVPKNSSNGFEPRSLCHGGGGGGKGGGGGGAAASPTIIYQQAPAPDTTWKTGPYTGMSFNQGVMFDAIKQGVFPSTPGTNYNIPPPPLPANTPVNANASSSGQGAVRAGAATVGTPAAQLGAQAMTDSSPLGLPGGGSSTGKGLLGQ